MAFNRRRFLYCSGVALCGSVCIGLPVSLAGGASGNRGPDDIRGRILRGEAPAKRWKWSREGYRYRRLESDQVQCLICPNRCTLSPGDRSICRSKVNLEGTLYTLAYGNPCAVHNDPVEKKPLYHFRPQTKVFSLAAAGCNFRCLNCQNWEISQARPEALRFYELFPAAAVEGFQRLQDRLQGAAVQAAVDTVGKGLEIDIGAVEHLAEGFQRFGIDIAVGN